MKHFQKILTYLIVFIISFVFIQTDLLSQNDSHVKKDTLTIGGLYKVTLVNGQEFLGELQGHDSVSIRILLNGNVLNIKRGNIRSIEIPKNNYSKKSSFEDLNNDHSYWSIGVTGGGIIPTGSLDNRYDFSWSIGADFIYHIKPYWAMYGNITYNFFNYEEPDYYYGYSSPDNSASYLEIIIGTRSYLSQEKTRVFIDAGMGLYSFNESFSSEADDNLGINLGFGADIILSKKVDFVAKIKMHGIFSDSWNVYTYAGIYTGIKYNF